MLICQHFRFVMTTDRSIERTRTPKMSARLTGVGTSMWGMLMKRPSSEPRWLMYSFMASSIFTPTKMRMMPRPYFK